MGNEGGRDAAKGWCFCNRVVSVRARNRGNSAFECAARMNFLLCSVRTVRLRCGSIPRVQCFSERTIPIGEQTKRRCASYKQFSIGSIQLKTESSGAEPRIETRTFFQTGKFDSTFDGLSRGWGPLLIPDEKQSYLLSSRCFFLTMPRGSNRSLIHPQKWPKSVPKASTPFFHVSTASRWFVVPKPFEAFSDCVNRC